MEYSHLFLIIQNIVNGLEILDEMYYISSNRIIQPSFTVSVAFQINTTLCF